MPAKLSAFVLGATGYIGGAALIAIKKAYPDFVYTALVRSEKDVAAVQAIGVSVIVGSTENHQLVADAVAHHDITLNAADADDLPLAKNIISALKKRAGAGGHARPIYIHTSGTGVVSTQPPTGKFQDSAKKIWNDNNTDDIASIGPDQPHRNVDLAVFDAGESGQIATYIVAPSTIYDIAHTNPVRKLSQQIPNLIRTALAKEQTIYMGEGTNLWNNVHIYDVAELYALVLGYALAQNQHPSPPTNKFSNFFFGSIGEHAWGDVARSVAKILHAHGQIKSPKAVSVEVSEELVGRIGSTATNSRSVSERGITQLGWKSTHRPLEEALEDDVVATLKIEGRA
ncbi:hypothetical protein BOTBODRAFT_26603 [Botryobasidium botryosum FD-172 SS1]|uniref:Uncharacterized protein n=1 Tax=Botryobasidium botryosum (strain FD-172 SS1) TaxID=930990 RepID=A0A067MYA1_BOTB1|nr:hypothetical protein BOTBODRAFT_26603 [Botryobasidium botryosum FD-172 SS1]